MRHERKNGTLKVNKSYPGEHLETKLARMMLTGGGIEKIAEPIYAEEYMPAMDIRTDRFEVALDAMIKGDDWQRRKKNVAAGLNPDGTEKVAETTT